MRLHWPQPRRDEKPVPPRRRWKYPVSSAIAWPYVLASLALGFVLPHIRQGPFVWANPILRQDQVLTFLSAVSSGMMAFTGIVFSLLLIMLQFGSSAYYPDLVGMLSRNKTLTHAGGVFTGTFLYSLMALREAGTLPHGETPSLTLWVAFFWLLASVYLLLRLVRVFAGLAITEVLEMLSDAGRAAIEKSYGPYIAQRDAEEDDLPARRSAPSKTLVHTGRPLYLVGLDVPRLVSLAREVDGVIRVFVAIGDCVSPLTRVAVVEGARAGVAPIPAEEMWSSIHLARDRTDEQGPKQSIRLLVDIALRALSAGINDPTSAVRALDQIEGLLIVLGRSNLDIGRVRDASGDLRLVHPAPTWDEYLDLAVTEIQYYGQDAVHADRSPARGPVRASVERGSGEAAACGRATRRAQAGVCQTVVPRRRLATDHGLPG